MVVFKDYLISDTDHKATLVPQGSLLSPHMLLVSLSAPNQSHFLNFFPLFLFLSFSCPAPVLISSYKVTRNLGGKGRLKESLK